MKEQISEEIEAYFNKFIKHLESLIEFEKAELSTYSDLDEDNITIVKKDSELYNEIKNDLSESPNGWYYTGTYENFRDMIIYNLMEDQVIGCDLRIHLNNNFKKYYGLALIGNSEILYLDSETTLNSHLKASKTPERNVIYCGGDKNDFICGFDVI